MPGNALPASIYLSEDNRRTLDKELTETYGETIRDLERAQGESRTALIRLRKLQHPAPRHPPGHPPRPEGPRRTPARWTSCCLATPARAASPPQF